MADKTQLEKSLAAVDRAIKKLGKEGIQEIIDSIPDIPGPTIDEYFKMVEQYHNKTEKMGLDTSHNAWHGPYSSFNSWREEIAKLFNISLRDMYGFGGNIYWETIEYKDIHILLNHSDCDGKISWREAKLIADDLTSILDKIEDDWVKRKALQFIEGCELAFSKQENIDFH